jgi:hypothetical protein
MGPGRFRIVMNILALGIGNLVYHPPHRSCPLRGEKAA